MVITTTTNIEGRKIAEYLGVCSGEAVVGADALVGVDLDYEVLGDKGSMLMVVASGTAVRLG